MTSMPFSVLVTARFERDYRKLLKAHTDLGDQFHQVVTALSSDPFNHSRSHPIKKLVGIKPGDGQYRIRFKRFRFIYDIEGRVVFLKHCRLRDEGTYN